MYGPNIYSKHVKNNKILVYGPKICSKHDCIVCTFFLNPLPDDKILDWSKLKQSADNYIEFDSNSRKFSKLVENTVGKGEISRHEQFLLFPQDFQKACFPGPSKGVIVWEWVNNYLIYKANFFYSLTATLASRMV